MKQLLIGYPLNEYQELNGILSALSERYSVVIKDYDYKWLSSNIHKFEVIVPSLGVVIDDEIISNAVNLRLIFTPTTGIDHIRISPGTKEVKILALTDFREQIDSVSSTAELGFWFVLSLSRKSLLAHEDVVRRGRWERNDFLGNSLAGKMMGIIGMGRIGRKLAKYAEAFGMEVVYWDKVECEKWRRIDRLETLLSCSDFVVLSISLNEQTQQLINMGNIGSVKKGASLVNISRGQVIEEKAVCLALQNGVLGGVGVDVLEMELANHKESPLLRYVRDNPGANVIITPHIGGATIDSWKKVFSLVSEKILEGGYEE